MIRRNTTRLGAAQPVASQYGILSPATTVFYETTEDWIAGYEYETSDASAKVEIASIFGNPDPQSYVAIDSEEGDTFHRYYPFNIQASVKSSTFGVTLEEVQKSADKALEVVTPKAIEHEFWNGTLAKKLSKDNENRYLANSVATDVTPVAGTGVKVRYGQALLEKALGEATIGSQGLLHAPLDLASAMKVEDVDGALTTNLGTKVVAGAGYSNTGPDGTAAPAGHAWMYATGPLTVHVSKLPTIVPEVFSQAVDHGKNTVEFFVDRSASVTWSTSNLYAVLVDLTLDYA